VARKTHASGKSESDVTREALIAHLGLDDSARELSFVALGASGHRNTARDAEDILATEWVRDVAE
jgi:hypothetical protein